MRLHCFSAIIEEKEWSFHNPVSLFCKTFEVTNRYIPITFISETLYENENDLFWSSVFMIKQDMVFFKCNTLYIFPSNFFNFFSEYIDVSQLNF